ncbi:hypothetical protein BOTBODRAFT_30057 [Botryobasidium botryosum FD-172 SS1]|uniref:Uncharacterized protein n=1 Tax=Botryobasidium botryosum (strain FD-172 SS1) TaxID=930990 RepID=A0A067MZC2_BOTB1|nr:hypothetical protein BOTBODRAFT_30057 [Botryobasidium botryosum FD-172 SS1]
MQASGTYNYKYEAEFFASLTRSLGGLDLNDAQDVYEVVKVLDRLAFSHSDILSAEGKRTGHRLSGITDIIKVAFSRRVGRNCTVLNGAKVRVRKTRPPTRTASLVSVAEILVIAPCNKVRFEFIHEIDFSWEATWPEAFSIIGFACEFELSGEGKAARKLAVDLSTAQSQRKSLGLPDEVIYGIIRDGSIQVYACWWQADESGESKIWFRRVNGGFDLKHPVQVIKFYIFLSKMHDHIMKLKRQFDLLQALPRPTSDQYWRAHGPPPSPMEVSSSETSHGHVYDQVSGGIHPANELVEAWRHRVQLPEGHDMSTLDGEYVPTDEDEPEEENGSAEEDEGGASTDEGKVASTED